MAIVNGQLILSTIDFYCSTLVADQYRQNYGKKVIKSTSS